jgi:spore germination cell wall hydrolase CwlJ-like protein
MNRLDSRKWGDNICGVVGAKRQFAPGVMTRPMNSKAMPDVMAAADSVLKGERHPKVKKEVMFFHTAGLKFPYKNMHYTTVAGGNAFYEKRDRRRMRNEQQAPADLPTVMVASNEQPAGLTESKEQPAVVVASNEQPVLPETVTLAANEPIQRDKSGRVADTTPPPGVTGLPEPEADRFGGEAPTMTAEMKPVFDTADSAMSYEASPEQASAIGALLLAQQTE